MTPARAILRRSLRDSCTRMLSFALLFGIAAAAQATTYRLAYPTLADRLSSRARSATTGARPGSTARRTTC